MTATNLFQDLARVAEEGHRAIQARTATAEREARIAAERERTRAIARELSATMGCNCDLDNWEPERSTGHSWVCRIHKETIAKAREAQQ